MFSSSLVAQEVARNVVDCGRRCGLLEQEIFVEPDWAVKEKALLIDVLKELYEYSRIHQDLQPDEMSSVFTFIFAKAAEVITNWVNKKEEKIRMQGLLDGCVPLYADDTITEEFKKSLFPSQCAQEYLMWSQARAQQIAQYDSVVVLGEALKWTFRLGCHYAWKIVQREQNPAS